MNYFRMQFEKINPYIPDFKRGLDFFKKSHLFVFFLYFLLVIIVGLFSNKESIIFAYMPVCFNTI